MVVNHRGYTVRIECGGECTVKSPDGTPLGKFISEREAYRAADQHRAALAKAEGK